MNCGNIMTTEAKSNQEDDKDKDGSHRPRGIVQTRYIFTIMMFLGFIIGISNRVALSVVIVGMLDQCNWCFYS